MRVLGVFRRVKRCFNCGRRVPAESARHVSRVWDADGLQNPLEYFVAADYCENCYRRLFFVCRTCGRTCAKKLEFAGVCETCWRWETHQRSDDREGALV